MMKNVFFVLTILVMASAANAAMSISVNGVVNPADTEITLMPSDIAIIDIHGDSGTPIGIFFLGINAGGPGSLDIANATMVYQGNAAAAFDYDDPDVAGMLGIDNPLVGLELSDIAVEPIQFDGLLVDNIAFHCEAIGDVTISLFDGDGVLMDSQVIHEVPEPITFALLGLGGLFLRRRK
jgi:hypothetical protein